MKENKMDSLEERLQDPSQKRTEITSQSRMKEKHTVDLTKFCRKTNYIIYDNLEKRNSKNCLYTYCLISVVLSFILGLSIGIILMSSSEGKTKNTPKRIHINTILKEETNDYNAVTFTGKDTKNYLEDFTDSMKDILKDNEEANYKIPNENTVLYNNVYFGPEIEDSMPQGYGDNSAEVWEKYVDENEVVKMEIGCGRMQNRLVTFKDGTQACVRYRQNTDQIQGEIFSFYTGRLLNLTNLAPSVIKIVDTKDKLWKNVANEIGNALWNSNRAVVLTKYIPSLESASIPDILKPTSRHLNKYDILKMVLKENDTKINVDHANFSYIDMKISKKVVKTLLELAQWSDLIIFDFLTANLDRMVNNLFNFQWNINIMDGPAHNLARKMDSGLLVFLDNESGLLHGYRLLKKYNAYHNLMLNNLCLFRKTTVDSLKYLYDNQSVGRKISEMFHEKNSAVVRDVLPSLPEKNSKILHERIGRVLSQIEKCVQTYR